MATCCAPVILGLGQTGSGGGSPGPPGAAGPGYLATSATSLVTAGSGSRAFTTQAGLAYTAGARIRATSTGTGDWMEGVTASYSGTTLTVTMDLNSGTGTNADWDINLAGERGATGPAAGTPTGTGFVHVTSGTADPVAQLVFNADVASNAAIVLSKLAAQADQTVVGNVSGGSAVPIALSQAQLRTLLGYAAIALSGSASDLSTGTVPLARLAGITNAELSASAAIALSKLATIADQTILGNNSGSTGVPLALTATQVRTLLGLATVATSGSASDLGSGTLPLARLVNITNTEISASAAIALTKIATIAAHTFLGNNTGSTGAILALTATQLQAELADWNANTLKNFVAEVVVDTGTTLTLSGSHRGRILTQNNASAITTTLPNSLEIGFSVTVYQKGAGQITFAAGSGATLVNRQTQTKTAGQYAVVTLFVEANSGGTAAVWVLAGDTAA